MRELKFRVCIPNKKSLTGYDIILFNLMDLVQLPHPRFSIRELVIPFLRAGNDPDRYTGIKDVNGVDVYEGDVVEIMTIGRDAKGRLDYGGTPTLKNICEVRIWPSRGVVGIVRNKTFYKGTALRVHQYHQIIGNKYENPELLESKKG